MGIFDKIKQLCDERNINISSLERSLEFSRGSIYKMATSAPSSDKLKQLADFFNVSADYLLGRIDSQVEYFIQDRPDMVFETFIDFCSSNKHTLTLDQKLKITQELLSENETK